MNYFDYNHLQGQNLLEVIWKLPTGSDIYLLRVSSGVFKLFYRPDGTQSTARDISTIGILHMIRTNATLEKASDLLESSGVEVEPEDRWKK